ncbi:MAG: type II secretion system F family protein, partial [Planctomycetes bacterium]|nr:type II secretion system F family protein [Planctomycetota bacterium]
LQVVSVRPVRPTVSLPALLPLGPWHRHLRTRRRHDRTELYDNLATMLDAGLPLLDAGDTIIASTPRSALRSMLVDVRERLRSGATLDDAMREHPSWFDACEIAMVGAGHRSGHLSEVLRTLAERHERSGQLSQKLAAALTYPFIVALIGIAVVIFLSVKTLPDLTKILVDAGIEIPALTSRVMAFGQFIAGWWYALLAVVLGLGVAAAFAPRVARRLGWSAPTWLRRLTPRTYRRMAVSQATLQLAELLRTGVPMVEALRVVAPTVPGTRLPAALLNAADRLERGESVADALDDPIYFDGAFRRLLDLGQRTGELTDLLEQVGARYERQARRLIDRLATVLEPAVIVVLAALIGVVVMAAVLPILRLQEIL